MNRAARDGDARLLTPRQQAASPPEHPGYGDPHRRHRLPRGQLPGVLVPRRLVRRPHHLLARLHHARRVHQPQLPGADHRCRRRVSGVDDTGVLAARIRRGPRGRPAACASCWPGASPTASTTGTRWGSSRSSATAPPPKFEAGEWRNWYATRFADSAASAGYCLREWERLQGDTPGVPRRAVRQQRAARRARRRRRDPVGAQQLHGAAAGGRHLLRLRGGARRPGLLRGGVAPTYGTTPTRCRSCSPTWSARCATPTSATTRAPTAA